MGGSEPELRRTLGLVQVVLYGVGLILGAGIYVVIGDAAAISGNVIWISFILAAVVATFTGLSYAELASMFPKCAAEYIYVKQAFGINFVALFVGCLTIFVAITSAATVAIGFSGYLSIFLPNSYSIAYAVILIIILSIINLYGIKESAWTNSIFTLVEISGLLIVIIAAFSIGSIYHVDFFELPEAASASFASSTLAILTSTALIFFAYYGFESISNISEETKNPTRIIPKGLLISILVTSIIYVLVAISSISLVGWRVLSLSEAPLAVAIESALGKYGIFTLSIIALFATTNSVLMMLVSGSRIIYGISRDGAIPHMFSNIQKNRRTPWIAVLTIMIFSILAVSLSLGNIVILASLSVFGIFVAFAFVNLSLIWLRFKQSARARPFKSPIEFKKFPILAGLGLITTLFMLFQFDRKITAYACALVTLIIILSIILTKLNGSSSRKIN